MRQECGVSAVVGSGLRLWGWMALDWCRCEQWEGGHLKVAGSERPKVPDPTEKPVLDRSRCRAILRRFYCVLA